MIRNFQFGFVTFSDFFLLKSARGLKDPQAIILFGNNISSEQDEMKKVEKTLRRGSATLDSRQSPN